MNSRDSLLVQKSFARCSKSPGFFDDFYNHFLASSNEISDLFANVSRSKQKVFVHTGISTLLLYAMGSAKSKQKLASIAESHDSDALRIRPELYPLWKESLIRTVEKHDPQFSPELQETWQAVIDHGIKVFIDKQA